MAYKLILFDFDGTLADYMPYAKEMLNIAAKKYRFKPIKDLELLRNMTIRRFLKHQKVPIYKLPLVLLEAQKFQLKNMSRMKLPKGMREVLEKLKKKYKIAILSSNRTKVIYSFLGRHDLDNMFDFVETYHKIFAKSVGLGKMLITHNLKHSEVLYVGDEIRDIQATRKVRIDMVAVTWGLNGEEILRKYKPKYIIKKPEDLIALV